MEISLVFWQEPNLTEEGKGNAAIQQTEQSFTQRFG
jgi:hypothetical protein